MGELETILEFLEHRADSLFSWALAYEGSAHFSKDGAECKARAQILRAQSRIVDDLVKEIKSATILEPATLADGAPAEGRRLVVLSEMTGPMDAVIIADPSHEVVHGHDVEDHEALLDAGEGCLELKWVEVPPSRRPTTGTSPPRVDLRYAFVTYKDGGFNASIHNSLAEANAVSEEWSEEHNAFVVDHNNSIAVCSVSPILIPRRGSG